MTRDPATGHGNSEGTDTAPPVVPTLARDRLGGGRPRVVGGASLLALLAVAVRTGLDVLANLPFRPIAVPSPLREAAAVTTPLILGVALGAIAVTSDRAVIRVGLLFVAVFGVVGVFAPGGTLPAAVAVVAGAALAFSGLGWPSTLDRQALRRRGLALGFVAAVAVSLVAETAGLEPSLGDFGAWLALGSVAAVGTLVADDWLAVGAGATATAAVVFAGATNPYVVGSALLVGFAVTGVPYLLVALAVGGSVAAAIGSFRRGEYARSTGACLLVLAGLPVTFPRAMTALLGATLLVANVLRPGDVVSTQEVSA